MEKTIYLQNKALELKVRKYLERYKLLKETGICDCKNYKHLINIVFCRFNGQVSSQI